MNSKIKGLIPPLLFNVLKGLKPKNYGWFGNYNSWEDAVNDSEGYDKTIIVEKVKKALKQVVQNEAVFERDSVLFYEPDYNYQLLSSILFVAAKHAGELNLIDFGGSLGSSYYQNKAFLKELKHCSWNVIEQQHFVEIGKKEFQNEQLSFYYNMEDCLKEREIDCLLLSSVLQYLPQPYQQLDELFLFNIKTIIVDRMPFNTKSLNRISVQKVHPDIYDASYPCHLLNSEEFVDYFIKNGYSLHTSFDAIDGKGLDYIYKGYIFERA